VPREALLNHFADVAEDGTYSSPIANETRRFFTMLGTLVRGRISVAGGAGTATQKALTLAIRYGNIRRQFADPATGEESAVLDYLVHQRKLLPALATTYALHFAQDELVHTMHEVQRPGAQKDRAQRDEDRQRELETMAAGVKAVGTWHATRTIQMCREACGGAGYLSENLLPQLKADTDVFTTFEGDNTVLLQLVAKTILSDYGKRVGKLDLAGKARFGVDLVAGLALERTGARALISRGGLRDRAYQRYLFVEREEHQIANAAQRMRAALKPQTKALLGKVLDLHALSVIEAERGFFTGHAYLTAGRAKTVTQEVNALCGELRPHARDLVDGFAIPETWLECPLLAGEHDATAPATNPAPATAEPSTLSGVG
jgi:acyl-CoA oxidase